MTDHLNLIRDVLHWAFCVAHAHDMLKLGFILGFHGSSDSKKSACRDTGSIRRSGKFPGKGNGNTLQYSCLGNPGFLLYVSSSVVSNSTNPWTVAHQAPLSMEFSRLSVGFQSFQLKSWYFLIPYSGRFRSLFLIPHAVFPTLDASVFILTPWNSQIR